MPTYCFNWTASGSVLVTAENLTVAHEKFDAMSLNQCVDHGDLDFTTDQILIEREPGVFEELTDAEAAHSALCNCSFCDSRRAAS